MSVNGKDYEILKLLGHGKGGYSYLATDGSRNYVLKQIHHEPCSYYTFGNKIEAENDRMEEKYFSQIKEMCGKYTLLILILIMNVITIWKNGILKTGE